MLSLIEISFNKNKYTLPQAKMWLHRRSYKTADLKITLFSYIFVQSRRKKFDTIFQKELGPGIWFTFGITKCVGKECKCFQKVRNYP